MKRGLSCGGCRVWKLLNHRGHRGNTEGELIGKHKKHKKRPAQSISSFVALVHFRGGLFLPSSVSSVVNLKLKN